MVLALKKQREKIKRMVLILDKMHVSLRKTKKEN
jgi:hypothetical protein